MKRNVTVRVLPTRGDIYSVTIVIDDEFDAEEQVDNWIDNNLVDVEDWEWVSLY